MKLVIFLNVWIANCLILCYLNYSMTFLRKIIVYVVMQRREHNPRFIAWPSLGCWTDGLTSLCLTLEYLYIEEYMVDSVPRSCGCKKHSAWQLKLGVCVNMLCLFFTVDGTMVSFHFGVICLKDIVPEVL